MACQCQHKDNSEVLSNRDFLFHFVNLFCIFCFFMDGGPGKNEYDKREM